MTEVTSGQEAIKIAKDVILEAGHSGVKIRSVDYDEDEEVWNIEAYNDDVEIDISIDAETGEVLKFNS